MCDGTPLCRGFIFSFSLHNEFFHLCQNNNNNNNDDDIEASSSIFISSNITS
jgi:hypothetical protein